RVHNREGRGPPTPGYGGREPALTLPWRTSASQSRGTRPDREHVARPGHTPTHTWSTFLRNHAHHVWAADLLTVPTLTANSTAAWACRQLSETTSWRQTPR